MMNSLGSRTPGPNRPRRRRYIGIGPKVVHPIDQIKTSLREILESKDRNSAGITINPRGLIFLGPNYENITKLSPAKSPLIRI